MANNVMTMNGSFKPFRFWCQHVLPLVYDDSLSYMELLNKVITYINQFGEYLDEFSALNEIKYEGEWIITKQYPAWSVVSVNGEAGYISIQPVPAGINYTDTNYWRLIADFTAEIAGLAERVVALEAADVAINGEIASINSNIGTINTKINTINTNLSSVENDIDEIESDIEDIQNSMIKKVFCVSDSYGLTPTEQTSWCAYLKQFLNIPNNNFFTACYNGSGFAGVDSTHRFIDITQAKVATMSSDELNSITDVVIVGGYNDAYAWQNGIVTTAGLRTLIGDFITYVHTNMPKAKIWICMPAWGNHYDRHEWLSLVKFIYHEACTYYSNIAFIDNVDWMHKTSLRDSSGFHPTESCSRLIGTSIGSVMNGGNVSCDLLPVDFGHINPTFERDTDTTGGFSWSNPIMRYMNGNVEFTFEDIRYLPTAVLANEGTVHIGDFNETIMTGGATAINGYKQLVSVRDNSNGNYYNCILRIYANGLYLTNISGSSLSTSIIIIQPSTISGSCML